MEQKFAPSLLPHQDELIHLAELAGVYMSPHVFRIIVELLNMQVEPAAIYKVLKQIRRTRSVKQKITTSGGSNNNSAPSS